MVQLFMPKSFRTTCDNRHELHELAEAIKQLVVVDKQILNRLNQILELLTSTSSNTLVLTLGDAEPQ